MSVREDVLTVLRDEVRGPWFTAGEVYRWAPADSRQRVGAVLRRLEREGAVERMAQGGGEFGTRYVYRLRDGVGVEVVR